MEKNQLLWLGLALVVIVVLFQLAQPQIMVNLETEEECEQELLLDKQKYPQGIFPDSCVLYTSLLDDCRQSCGYSASDEVGDWVYAYDSDGVWFSEATECTFNCLHSVSSFCTDSDGGKNYNLKGRTIVQYFEGGTIDYGDDQCGSSTALWEHFCIDEPPYESSEYYNCAIDGGNCVDGACVGGTICNTFADTNCDGLVSKPELIVAIQAWLGGTLTKLELIPMIQAWLGG